MLKNRGKTGADVAQNPTHCIKSDLISLNLVWKSLVWQHCTRSPLQIQGKKISKIHLLRSRGTDVFTWNRMDALQCKQIAICQNFKRQIQYIWCTNFYKFHQYYLATWMQFTIREKSNILSHLQGRMHPKSHGLIHVFSLTYIFAIFQLSKNGVAPQYF